MLTSSAKRGSIYPLHQVNSLTNGQILTTSMHKISSSELTKHLGKLTPPTRSFHVNRDEIT